MENGKREVMSIAMGRAFQVNPWVKIPREKIRAFPNQIIWACP
jgi:hypothetical protein